MKATPLRSYPRQVDYGTRTVLAGLVGTLVLLATVVPALGQHVRLASPSEQDNALLAQATKESMSAVHYGLPEVEKALPAFVYPEQAKNFRIEGRVVVAFRVDERGRVIDPEIRQSLGYGCDEEVLRVLRQARFKPVLDDKGVLQPTTNIVAFDFQLDEE